MASKVVSVLFDDVTGEEIVAGRGETLTFALDGVSYEIDLELHWSVPAFLDTVSGGQLID